MHPSAAIWLDPRFNVVTVEFIFKASPSAMTPSLPIRLFPRSNVVTVEFMFKASQSAIKIISDKKGKIDYNEKVKKTKKIISKEEKVKKN